jgi:hypothetical protein
MSARVTEAVIEELNQLRDSGRGQAAAAFARVVQALDQGAEVDATPVNIPVPDAPPGRRYLAAIPRDDPSAPVVIYRKLGSGGHDYRVVTLFDRDKYYMYQQAERQGLLDDPAVDQVIRAVAADAISHR